MISYQIQGLLIYKLFAWTLPVKLHMNNELQFCIYYVKPSWLLDHEIILQFPRQCRPSLFHNCLPHQNGMVRIIFTFLAIFGARGSRVYTLLWKKSDFYLDSQAERLNWNRFLFNVYKTYTGSKEFSFNSFFPSLLLEKWFLEKKESIFVL